ncbi:MAG TPA: hypothetical protein VML55_11395 [Planctomycetaceae bacterium]|nr:hypothetical protein [Planctomycetaceae bacterium]
MPTPGDRPSRSRKPLGCTYPAAARCRYAAALELDDFIFGWVGDGQDPEHGRVLLLQVIPRPHLRAQMN